MKISNFATVMPSHSSFIYKIIGIGVIFLCLLSCAPKPELEWIPEIKSVSAKVTDNTCVLTAETSAELAGGYDCGFLYGKTRDNMRRVKASAEGKKFNFILESLDYDTDYVYRAYVSNGRNEICSEVSYFRILKEKETPKSMTLPFHTIEVGAKESEFLVYVGGEADFTVNIPDTVVWVIYRRDNRTCRFQVKANPETDDRRCDVVFTNLSDNQSDTLSVVQAAKANYGDDYIDEYGINHGPGVKIGETVWAPVNCGYHTTDFKYGKLYQWGRKYGQGYYGNFGDADNNGEYSDAFVPEKEAGPVDLATGQSDESKNKFYCSLDEPDDWCALKDDHLWNSGTEDSPVKTEYDPCPDGWRVPALAELDELSANHSSWVTNENGQSGFCFSGPNVYSETGPQVFFPAAGFHFSSGLTAYGRGTIGSYWSSSQVTDYSSSLLDFSISQVTVNVGASRATGLSVRCVQDDSVLIPVANIALSKTSMSLSVGNSETITYSITPSNANHQSAHWWSDNPEIASVDQNGNVAGVSGGATIIYVMAGMQVATCSVTVTGTSNPGDYIDEYGINHGPGVKIGETVWAPVNCGYHATDYAYGKLYQWGRKCGHGYNGVLWDVSGNYIGEYSDAFVPERETGPVDLATGQSSSNSNKFYYNSSSPYDWCSSMNDELWNSGNEENPVKTEYDPCPVGWRVPTYAELDELNNNYSSWTTDDNGQNGRWLSGGCPYSEAVPQVFFPAAGSRRSNDGLVFSRGGWGHYWSSGLFGICAYYLYFGPGYVDMSNKHRADGASVRCVQDDSALIPVANIALSKTSMSLSVGNSETITYSITPSNANHQSAHWWSDNPEIASVDQNGNVTGVSKGATIIYAMAGMQVATCSVTVTRASNPVDYIDEYGINHGPGVKIGETVWAPVNCGYHSTDFKYGKLYQWGRKYGQGYSGPICDEEGYHIGISSDISEPELVEGPVSLVEGQSESNANLFYCDVDGRARDWCTPSDDRLWNSGTEESPVKTEYDPCPSGWRVPTYAELDELSANYSSWTTDENGQSGYWLSGPNVYTETAPQVFFPAAGYRTQTQGWAVCRGNIGNYWSSRPMAIYPDTISILYFHPLSVDVDVGSDRPAGFSVRCVIK